MTEDEYFRLLQVMRSLVNCGEENRAALTQVLDLINSHTDSQGGNRQPCQSPPPSVPHCNTPASPAARIIQGPEPCTPPPLNNSGGFNNVQQNCTPPSGMPPSQPWSPTPICPPSPTNLGGSGTGTYISSTSSSASGLTWITCPYCNKDLHVNLRLGFVEKSDGTGSQNVTLRVSLQPESSSQNHSSNCSAPPAGVSYEDGSYYTRPSNPRPPQPNCRPFLPSPQNCSPTGQPVLPCSPPNVINNSSAYQTPINYLNPSGNLIPPSSPHRSGLNDNFGLTFPTSPRTC